MAAAPVLTLIGQTLREMRTERGMTQQQLADLCEMHRTFIISIEKPAERFRHHPRPPGRRSRRSTGRVVPRLHQARHALGVVAPDPQ
jgi:hypothetical protein